MRTIRKVILHCSATPEGRPHTAAEIDRWHRERGWSGIGYHYVIQLDGTIEEGRPLEKIGAHVAGHNKDSIGICYIGGLDAETWKPKDTRTDAQRWALKTLVGVLLVQHPGATVHGHNEFAAKACPCFDVQAESWGISEEPVEIEKPTTKPAGVARVGALKPIIVPGHIRYVSDIKEDDIRAECARTGRSPEEVAVSFLERVADAGEAALGPVSRVIALVRRIRG